jgi:glycosyltransferase involved in cell wall biosynthesis
MKVSVIVPTYNNEATIATALESIFAQRFQGGFEVIVVNDGSTDGTSAVLKTYGDRIRVIDQQNAGVAAARNAGIRAAAGEYIALLDGDDTWTQDKLEKTVPVLDRNPGCVAVFSDATIVDDAGTVLWPHHVPAGFDHSPTLDEMLGSRPWPIMVGSIVMRRDAILAVGGLAEEFGRDYGAEDVFTFLLLRERGEIIFVPENLARWRMPTFGQRLAKCLRPLDWNGKSHGALPDPDQYFRGYLRLARIILERYGARGRKLADFALDSTAREEAMLGMMAMHQGDRQYARRCYISSIRNRPRKLKTYLRLAWAILPVRVAETLSAMLSPRLRRSLSGPPFMREERLL